MPVEADQVVDTVEGAGEVPDVPVEVDLEPAIGRGLLELLDVPLHDDTALVDDCHLLAEVLDQVQLVGAEHDGLPLGRGLTQDPDRKSTRLNSSHVKNSYAVFCLKKKKHK